MQPGREETTAPAPAAPQAATDPPKPAGSILERVNPVRSILRHKFVALGLMTVIAVLGLPVAVKKGKPVYYSEAVIFISPRFLKNLQDDKEFEMQSNTQYREYVQQCVRTINRYDIVEDAYRQVKTFRDQWALPKETERHAIERLMGGLSIKPVPDTYQVTVGLENGSKVGLAEFVNGVVNVYLKKAKAEEFYASDARMASLKKEADELSADVASLQKQRTELAQELGVSIFTESYVNPYDRLLIAAKEGLADARRKRIEAEAQVRSLEASASGEKRKVVDAYALEMASRDAAVTTILATMNARRGELLAKITGLSEQHPSRIEATKEIAQIDGEQRRTLERLSANYSTMLLDQRRGELSRAAQVEKALSKETDEQQAQASWFVEKYQSGIAMGQLVERARKRLDSIDDRTRFLLQEGAAPGFARMFAIARPPDLPIRGGRTKIFAIFCALAVVLGIVVPLAVDVLDPRIFTIGDAGRTLGFETMGWIPLLTSKTRAFYFEQMLRIAHRIDQERTTHGTRIWCFTAAQSGSGTTSMVASLGKALRDLGISALTVEANAWRSDPRYRKKQGRGLTVALRGNSELLENVEPADADLPDHIPVGDLDDSGHLPDVHRLIDVLQGARHAYDVVLVDLPPILASVDAEYIAGRADIVVMVLRAVNLHKGDLAAALKVLERNQPKAVAAILNGVKVEDGPAFAQTAFEEFTLGRTTEPPWWLSPWLWK